MINFIEAIQNLLNPGKAEAYLAKELPNASTGGIAVNLAIVYASSSVAQLIGMVITALLLGALIGMPTALGSLLSIATPIKIAGTIVVGLVLMVVFCGVLHLIAKAFGGRGTFMGQLYLQSFSSAALAPISFFFVMLLTVPLVGCIVLVFFLIFALYMIYLLYLMMKVVYKLDSRKAAYTVAAYMGVCFIIGILLGIAILAFNIASIMGASQGGLLKPV